LGQFTPPPPRVLGSSQFTSSSPTVAGPSVFTPPAFLAGASTMLEAEDAVSLQKMGVCFYDGTLRESNHRFMHHSDEARSRSV
ncbi:hypothetical protein Taro_038851, partial [Colocasia esculenta]|nr:hypothetical protein [Colocasia esculenta]